MQKLLTVGIMIAIGFLSSSYGQLKRDRLRIKGSVVAYGFWSTFAGTSGSFFGLLDVYIVKLTTEDNDDHEIDYVIVHSSLRDEYFSKCEIDRGKEFRFKLVRKPTCDTSIEKMRSFPVLNDKGEKIYGLLPGLDISDFVKLPELPVRNILPCYRLIR